MQFELEVIDDLSALKVLSTSILHRTHVENSMSGLQSSRESRYLHTAPLREAWLAPNTSAHAPARKWRLRHLQRFEATMTGRVHESEG